MQARTASAADPKTAIRPSPVVLTTFPPAAVTAFSRIESWRSSARFIACGKRSQRRVLPSTSVNRKVKVPDALSGSTTFTPFDRPGTTALDQPGCLSGCYLLGVEGNPRLGPIDQSVRAMVGAADFGIHVSGCGLWTGS